VLKAMQFVMHNCAENNGARGTT